MDYGLQLYSVRDMTDKDLDGTLKKVAEIGYRYVEFAGFFGHSAEKVKAMLDGVKVGDRVRTIGGIYGTVVAVKEDLITVETTPETKIVFAKGAISTVENAEVEAADLQK